MGGNPGSNPMDWMECQELKGLVHALGKEEVSVSSIATGGV